MTESFNRKLGRLAQSVSGTGSITTNAATASAWQTARTITLGGDLSGSVSLDGSSNVSLTATVTGDSIVLGTDTTGNYVATVSAGSGITVTGSGTETAAVTVSIDNTVATLTGEQTLTNKTINVAPATGNVFQIQGNNISSYVGSGANVVLSSSPTITNLYIPGTGMYFNGSTSGITNLQATAEAGSTALTLPAATDTLVGRNTTDTLTNKTISGSNNTISNIGNASLTNSSITINGTSVSLGGTRTLVTDDVAEDGSPVNLWFTNSRARGAISVSDTGGDGSLSYDSGTGVITYTGPSATEVRAHLSAGTGLTYTTGQFAIDSTVVTLTGTQTLTNKTLTSPVISSISNTGTLTLPTSTDTLVGRATTDTLTNKTISGNDNTITNIGNASLSNSGITINGTSVSLGGTRTLVTDDISEDGSPVNLWYTDARARNAISVTDAGGDGSLTYSSGVITYTGPSASEVRAHFSAGTGVTLSSGQISIGQAVATTDNVTFAGVTADNVRVGVTAAGEIDTSAGNLTLDSTGGTTVMDDDVNVTGNLVVDGNLTVSGTTVTINATNLAVEDNMIYLNSGSTVTHPDLGFAGNYNDGTYRHAGLFRDESDGRWKFFHQYTPEPDASAYIDITHTSFALAPVQASSFIGNVTGNVTGNASTATTWQTARTLTLTGDVTGTSAAFDGSGNISISTTIAADSVALGTDTTGNYVASITNGSYITGGNGGSEGAALTLAVDATSANTASKVVARDASGNFSAGTITANLSGNASTVTNGVYTTDTGTVTNTMLAGSIANNKLANSTISGISLGSNLGTLTLGISGTGLSGSASYNGSSGATFTVTSNATSANTASTIVARDASGNFTAGTITAALSGNATTATTAGSITNQANSATITATSANTANQIVLRDGSGNFSAGTITANLTGNITNTVTGTNTTELVRGNMADNDQFRILIGGTATNAGYVEIATADDGTEPIHVRQYSGVFTSLLRTATLLDGSGNTSFPGTVTAPTFSGALSGNATTATTLQTARNINGVSFNGSADITVADSTKLPLSGGTVTGTLLTNPGSVAMQNLADATIGFGDANHSTGWGVGQAIVARTGDVIWALGSNGNTGNNDTLYLGIGSNANTTFSTALSFTQNRFATFANGLNVASGALQQGGNQVLHAGNYGSYAVPLSGGTMTGQLVIGASGIGMQRTQTNNGIWFNSGTDDNHVLWNDYFGGPGARGVAGSGFDGIKWNVYRGIHIRGGLSGAYNLIVVENSSGNTNDHTVKLYAANSLRLETTTSGVTVTGTLNSTGALTQGGNQVLHVGNYSSTLDTRYLVGMTNPSSVTNFTISIGNNGSYSFVQSHAGQPLELNPVGNAVRIAGNVVLHAGNYGSYALPIGGGTLTSRLNIHQSGAGGGENLFVGLETATSANGRAQLVLSSAYSDIVIASSQANNNHGSTLTFAAYNPSDRSDYRKFVINQGNWGNRRGFLDFGYDNINPRTNPHDNIDSADVMLTLDGVNKRVGVNQMNPSAALDITGNINMTGVINTTAAGGSILMRHSVSEVDAWIFMENAPNWGLYWKNAPSGQHTFGGYTSIGAELFGMSAVNASGNGVATTNYVGATSAVAQWMLSNYTGYIWSASTVFAAGEMRAPIFYDSTNPAFYCDPNGTSRIGGIQITPADTGTTGNGIFFYGVAGDNPASYDHAAIVERLWGTSDQSELIIFKGNDPDTSTIHDRIRIATTGRIVFHSTVTYQAYSAYISDAGTGNIAGSGYIYGNDLVMTGNVTAYSDVRLKTDITNITDALEKVLKIRGVTYNRTDVLDTKKRYAGVIAQEVEQVLPEVVSEDDEGMKNVAYGNMIGLLIEAIKEQQQEIEALKKHIKNSQ